MVLTYENKSSSRYSFFCALGNKGKMYSKFPKGGEVWENQI